MRVLSILFLAIAVMACGDDGGVSDTGTGTDTGAGSDTGTGSDAATDTGTATDAASDTASPTDAASDTASPTDAASDTASPTDAASDTASPTDAASDTASPTDAASDTSTPTDGGACSACIGAELTFGYTGGFVAFRRTSVISPCRTYTLTQESFSDPTTTRSCSNDVPCGDPGAVTIEDVNAALAHADVVAAFAAAPITYGRDSRPVDGVVYEISRSGDTFLVGAPCTGGGIACVPIPAGVQALADLLQALDAERLTEPDCTTVFP
jgi:hypothetical protein